VPDSDAARIARLDERLEGVREDYYSLMAEVQANRKRIHNLEGLASTFVETQKINRRREEEQYRRLEVRIQFLGLVFAAAAILSPVLVVLLAGK
jgi:hypothetical protein